MADEQREQERERKSDRWQGPWMCEKHGWASGVNNWCPECNAATGVDVVDLLDAREARSSLLAARVEELERKLKQVVDLADRARSLGRMENSVEDCLLEIRDLGQSDDV